MIYGCDLSHHQASDAVEQLVRGGKAKFVILRTGFGTYSKDTDFEEFIKDSEAAGLPNGAYHASYAGTIHEAVQEADFCIDRLEKTGAKVELPVGYDYEYFSARYNEQRGIATTPQLVQELTEAFCERVKERGYRPGVYTNLDYYLRFYGKEFFEKHPDYAFWYARPGLAKPDLPCDIWQYASNNGLADFGYNEDIDKNIIFDGDLIKVQVEPMKPLSEEPVKMYIGYASKGDIETLVTYIEGLGIETEVVDGYIITKKAVSRGDQCYIMTEVNRLGNIDCKIYEEPKAEDKQTEVEQLQAKIEQLENDLAAEVEVKRGWQEKAEQAEAEIAQLNRQLSAERASNEIHSKELAQCKDKLEKIKNIVA